MARMIFTAVALSLLSCSSRGGAPDASVAAVPAPVQPPASAGTRPTDAPPPTQFRRPVFDKAAMDQAIQAYERSHGKVQPAPATQP